jgi:hypothetical protein
MLKTVNEERIAENRLPIDSFSRTVKDKFDYRLKNDLSLERKVADCGTIAREKKCASHLTALNYAAACNAIVPLLKHRNQCANSDATTYQCSANKGDIIVYALPKNSYRHGNIKAEVDPDNPNENDLDFSIKHYCTAFAGGFKSQGCYIFSDKRMPRDMIKVYPVSGLGNGTDIASIGYIIMCNERSTPSNGAFYKYVYTTYTKTLSSIFMNDIASYKHNY